MKNKISDLNDILFAQLERLVDDTDKDGEKLNAEEKTHELKRAAAVVGISAQIIAAGNLRMQAAKMYMEHGDPVLRMIPEIGADK